MKIFKRISAILLASAVLLSTALSFPTFTIEATAADTSLPPDSLVDSTYVFKSAGDAMRDYMINIDNYEYDSDTGEYDAGFYIRSYNISTASMDDYVYSFLRQYPEIFFVKSKYSYNINGGYINKIWLTLRGTPDQAREELHAFADAVNNILETTPDFATDRETALYLHDHLANISRYNDDVANGNDPASESVFFAGGPLLGGDTVCQGYSYAYKYLLGQFGIRAIVVISSELNHAWNAVNIGNYWYHVDITWDDPIRDRAGQVLHENFLVSDSGFLANGHTSWDDINETTQTSTTYTMTDASYEDNTLFSLDTPVSYENGKWYYSSYKDALNTEIRSTSDIFADTVSSTLIKTVYHTHRSNTSNKCWVVTVGIAVKKGKIYYATHDTIYSCNLDGSGETVLATPNLPSILYSIYGVTIIGDYLYYNILDLNISLSANPPMYTLHIGEPPSVEIIDDTLSISDGKLFGLETFTLISEIAPMLEGDYAVYKNGSLVTDGYIGTGYVICRVFEGTITDSVTVSIVGDVYGDGISNSKDIIAIKLAQANKLTIDTYAADINGDGTVNTNDLKSMAQIIAG